MLAGNSMGAHTAVAYALDHGARLAGVVVIGPALRRASLDDQAIATWDRLADGLEPGGSRGSWPPTTPT